MKIPIEVWSEIDPRRRDFRDVLSNIYTVIRWSEGIPYIVEVI